MSRSLLISAALAATLGFAACTPSAGLQTAAPTTSVTAGVTAAPTTSVTAGVTAAPTAGATDDAAMVIVVRDFDLDPATISVAGDTVAFEVKNEGPTVHNVKVRDEAGTTLFGSRDLREGESETVVHEIAPGTYDLYCSLPGHESLGIKGTLTVGAS